MKYGDNYLTFKWKFFQTPLLSVLTSTLGEFRLLGGAGGGFFCFLFFVVLGFFFNFDFLFQSTLSFKSG